jgi:hypothetical protein
MDEKMVWITPACHFVDSMEEQESADSNPKIRVGFCASFQSTGEPCERQSDMDLSRFGKI